MAGSDLALSGGARLLLREQAIAFERPVAYVHGDSHWFRVDMPFLDAGGLRLEN